MQILLHLTRLTAIILPDVGPYKIREEEWHILILTLAS
jgi:hypothetical protein